MVGGHRLLGTVVVVHQTDYVMLGCKNEYVCNQIKVGA